MPVNANTHPKIIISEPQDCLLAESPPLYAIYRIQWTHETSSPPSLKKGHAHKILKFHFWHKRNIKILMYLWLWNYFYIYFYLQINHIMWHFEGFFYVSFTFWPLNCPLLGSRHFMGSKIPHPPQKKKKIPSKHPLYGLSAKKIIFLTFRINSA